MDCADIKKTLSEAIGTGEILTIIYHGGSEPGAARMIFPIKLDNTGVWAQCLASDRVKRFLFEKMEITDTESITYTAEDKKPTEPATLKDGIEPFLDELQRLGWHIMMNDGATAIGLFTLFKNGKPKKSPALQLRYEPETPSKPWKTCWLSFKYFARAVDKFMIAAREQAPSTANTVQLEHDHKPEPTRIVDNGNNLFPVFMGMLEQFEALEAKHIQTCLYANGVELYHCFQNGKPQSFPSFGMEFNEANNQQWAVYGLSTPLQFDTPHDALLELLRLGNI